MATDRRKSGGKLGKAERKAPKPSFATMSDFDHPMPRLMDYFKGMATVPVVKSARGGGKEG